MLLLAICDYSRQWLSTTRDISQLMQQKLLKDTDKAYVRGAALDVIIEAEGKKLSLTSLPL